MACPGSTRIRDAAESHVAQAGPRRASSGSASAVALGPTDIGLGTDTAGSVRVPASCCGPYSLRPTHGPVSNTGRIGPAPSVDTVGRIPRTPQLLDPVSEVFLPRPPAQPTKRLPLATDSFDLVDPSPRLPLHDAAHRVGAPAGRPAPRRKRRRCG
ncbi:amidase family protein [Streptomyces macrosporus]|uniref:Amidase domain-containing protein n=1 Tax=Streptomyces macrosporus TaxID=44032 RepID=A0ABN3KHT4_9ACTN